MTDTPFDPLAHAYEALVDWPQRLALETPFYRRLFDVVNARTVLDAACGTGHHAALFHSWGLQVEGADISTAMIEQARARFGEPPGLRWAVRGFHEPVAHSQPFDVALCVGNSLALAPDADTVQRTIAELLKAVTREGAVVIHAANLWRLPDGPCVWQKCRRAVLAGSDSLILKGLHRCQSRGYVNVVVMRLDDSSRIASSSIPLLTFESAGLERMARDAGAQSVEVYGGYRDEPYDRQSSADLIVVARRT